MDDDRAESATSHIHGRGNGRTDDRDVGEDRRAGKSRKLTKEEKKQRSGANKGRRFGKVRDELDLCWKVAIGKTCEYGEQCVKWKLRRSCIDAIAELRCRHTHDLRAYLEQKPKDIRFPRDVDAVEHALISKENLLSQDDQEIYCPVYEDKGRCSHGFRCRFLGGHIKTLESGEVELAVDEEKYARRQFDTTELNYLPQESLKLLRSKKASHFIFTPKKHPDCACLVAQPLQYPHPITDAYLKELQASGIKDKEPDDDPAPVTSSAESKQRTISEAELADAEEQKDTPDVPMRFSEKKRLHWKGLTCETFCMFHLSLT